MAFSYRYLVVTGNPELHVRASLESDLPMEAKILSLRAMARFQMSGGGEPGVRAIGQQDHLGSVACVELSHDVPDVHLHGAFAHAEFVGDYLVLLAPLEQPEHLLLTGRELDWISPSVHRTAGGGGLP